MIAGGPSVNRKILLDSQQRLDQLIRNPNYHQSISSLKIENNLNQALGKVPTFISRSQTSMLLPTSMETPCFERPPAVGSIESIDLSLKYVFNRLELVKINKNTATQNITSTIPTTIAQNVTELKTKTGIFIVDERNPFKESMNTTSNGQDETFYNYLQGGKRFGDN